VVALLRYSQVPLPIDGIRGCLLMCSLEGVCLLLLLCYLQGTQQVVQHPFQAPCYALPFCSISKPTKAICVDDGSPEARW